VAIDATKKTGEKTSHVVNFIVSMALRACQNIDRSMVEMRFFYQETVCGRYPFFSYKSKNNSLN